MSKNGFIRQTVAGVMVLSFLLSGCGSHRKRDTGNISKFDSVDTKSVTEATTAVQETAGVTRYEDIFYHAEKMTLSFPDLELKAGSTLIYSECEKPIFTDDYILAYVSQTYGDSPQYTPMQNLDGTYIRNDIRYCDRWVIFDSIGNYLGDLAIPDIPVEAVFDQDEQGNIIAFYSSYVSKDQYEGWALCAAKFAPSGELLMEEPRSWFNNESDPVGVCVGEDGEIAFATTTALFSANLDGTIHAVCSFPDHLNCVGLWEENDVLYTLLFPLVSDTSVYDGVDADELLPATDASEYKSYDHSILMPFTVSATGFINVAGEGKEADGLMTMHINPSSQGFCAATKNAIGAFNFETGEFCSFLDWNQTDADRSLITNGRFNVISEGVKDQPLDMLTSNHIAIPGLSIEMIEQKTDMLPSSYEIAQSYETDVAPSEMEEVTEDEMVSSNIPTTETPTVSTEIPSESTVSPETTIPSDSSVVDQAATDREEMTDATTGEEESEPVTMIRVATTEICEYGSVPVLLTVTPLAENPNANKQVIWVGGVNLVESPVTAVVAQYNADPDHSIWIKLHEYTDYNCNDDYGIWRMVLRFTFLQDEVLGNLFSNEQKAMEKMIEQVGSGNGPDIIYGAGEIGTLDQRGYLADLQPYMTGKNGIDREEYFASVFDAFKVNGNLYQIPLSFSLVGMYQQTSQTGKSVETFKDYLMLSDTSDLLSFNHSSVEHSLLYMASAEMNNWINYDTDEIRVSHDTLVDYLNMAETLCQSNGQSGVEFYGMEFDERYVHFYDGDKDIPIDLNEVGSIEEYCRSSLCMPDYDWTGLPGVNSGTTAVRTSNSVGIAAYSTQKEQAWEIISELLTKDAQVTMCAHASTPEGSRTAEFPVMRKAFFVEEFQLIDAEELFLFYDENDFIYTSYPTKTDILKDLEEVLASSHRRFIYDREVLQILMNETSTCLSDVSTFEESTDTIIRRLNQLGDN